MTGILLLDWAALAISLHNTILLLWLGLTVLLTAERRTWGIWFAGGSLLLASAFFFSHSAILGYGLNFADANLDFWWHVGWIPVLLLPFGWYAIALWYCGFWDESGARLRARQRPWFIFVALLTAGLATTLVFANPLPTVIQIATLHLSSELSLAGVPILLPLYIADIILCMVLSLDALLHPAPSPRMMGDLARKRARPWFVMTAVDLLLVGLLVGAFILWVVTNSRGGFVVDATIILAVGLFDLIIEALIAGSIVLIGQAVSLYEVFTGLVLPRRGLLRQWHNAVILGAGYGAVVSWSLVVHLPSINVILVTTALLAVFYALLGWRTNVERDRFTRQLRPFVTSQHLFDQLVAPTSIQADARIPFQALCRDVIGARTATLAVVGPLAPLVPSLAYPEDSELATLAPNDMARMDTPEKMCIQLDAVHWAVPLWSERGMIGVLVLGEKNDGGLYAQEEIEIARASGERLIDTMASAELAKRLMDLSRQRLVETQLLDQRARRVLHDDILPQLHAAVLVLGEANNEATDLLSRAHRQISDLLRDMPTSASDVVRLGVIGALRRAVEQEWANAFDSVIWKIDPDAELAARSLPTTTAETLYYAAREAVRNAERHGRGESMRKLNLHISAKSSAGLALVIEDDGVGSHANRYTQRSGHGLALHSAMLAVVGGSLSFDLIDGGGARVTISVPRADAC
jgi:signal transduction histidine kinase